MAYLLGESWYQYSGHLRTCRLFAAWATVRRPLKVGARCPFHLYHFMDRTTRRRRRKEAERGRIASDYFMPPPAPATTSSIVSRHPWQNYLAWRMAGLGGSSCLTPHAFAPNCNMSVTAGKLSPDHLLLAAVVVVENCNLFLERLVTCASSSR